jgi:general secretion pathway protein D
LAQVVEDESTVGLPTTLKRITKTTVNIKDGHTVVIGGLIDETMNQGTSQVPCLGGIPGFGWLFKSTSSSSDKTNLFIFVTPHIIENPAEAMAVYQEKKDEIEGIKEGVIKMYDRPGKKTTKQ